MRRTAYRVAWTFKWEYDILATRTAKSELAINRKETL